MIGSRVHPLTLRYAQEFKYWKDTANTFFDIATAEVDRALESGADDTAIVEAIAAAWHRCITAQWTLFKSGKQTCNKMAEYRGVVTQKQFHPAQLKKKAIDKAVDAALEDK